MPVNIFLTAEIPAIMSKGILLSIVENCKLLHRFYEMLVINIIAMET